MFRVCVGDDVVGPVFGLHIRLGQILSDNAKTEELKASDKDDHSDRGRPSGNRISEDQTAQDDKDQEQEGESRHQHSEPGGDAQRRLGEIDDSIDRIFEQLPETPFGLSGDALHILIGEPHGLETDPAEDTLGKAVVLGHG